MPPSTSGTAAQSWRLAACTLVRKTKPSVWTNTCRLRPFTFFPPSYPRMSPTPVVLTDWLSIIPAVGCALRPAWVRVRSRSAVCSWSQVPSKRHCRPILEDRLPGRQIAWQQAPGTPTPNHVENGIHNFAATVHPWSTPGLAFRQIWLDNRPFHVREIGVIPLLLHTVQRTTAFLREFLACTPSHRQSLRNRRTSADRRARGGSSV